LIPWRHRFAGADDDRSINGFSGRRPTCRADGACRLACDRGEADRARAVLLTVAGWTSQRIAEAIRRCGRTRSACGAASSCATSLKASVAPGPAPVKSEAVSRVVTTLLLESPVADRRNWTIARLRAEIAEREGVHISSSQLSKALDKKR
jgi:hypothetical protein